MTSASSSNLLLVLNNWKEFDLEAKKDQIFNQAKVIADNKEQNQPARTLLKEESKKFGATPPDQKLASLGPLVKLYQKEIDRLTANAVTAENAYLAIYNDLVKLVDPVDALKQATVLQSEKANENKLKLENEKLKRDLEAQKQDLQLVTANSINGSTDSCLGTYPSQYHS